MKKEQEAEPRGDLLTESEEIAELKRELELARLEIRRKDEFISITTHELRTPLTNLKTYVQLLTLNLTSYKPEKVQQFLEKMDQFVDQLNSRISDLLDVSRIEAGSIQYDFQRFNFQNMVLECIDNTRHTSPGRTIEVKGTIDDTFYGDRGRLQQVINNLLSNAIKYSPEEEPVILEMSDGSDRLDISVTDFGVGIPEDQLDSIFDRYSRVESDIRTAGLGLGLYISSRIVRQHSGVLRAESTPGKGTVIHMSLPKQGD